MGENQLQTLLKDKQLERITKLIKDDKKHQKAFDNFLGRFAEKYKSKYFATRSN
jgi:hypothetical protein